jgi:Uma2 family endonuclease
MQVEQSGTGIGGSVLGRMVQSIAFRIGNRSQENPHMATVTESSSSLWSAPATENAILEAMRNDILYEVVDHQVRELPPMGVEEGLIASRLWRLMSPFAWTAGLGEVVSEILFLLIAVKKLQRRPDLAFVSFQRWPRGRRVPSAAAWEVVPNLAIEVVSPTNFANDVLEKIEDYFLSGVERVWVIYPTVAKLYDYDSPSSVRVLTREQTLEGGTLLPGFQLPLAELFENDGASGAEMQA